MMWLFRSILAQLLLILALNAQSSLDDKGSFIALCYHDVADEITDRTILTTTTDQLISHLKWLKQNDYHPVSLDDIIEAEKGGKALPDHAVLLTFDDGYRSFYTRIFPLLQLYGFPAVYGLVANWQETPMEQEFDYGGQAKSRRMLLSWDEIKEMVDSGLVEIASHSYDAHRGVPSNPQGNTGPFYTAFSYDARTGRYESAEEYRQRVGQDMRRSSETFYKHLGVRPRAMVWPYGAYTQVAKELAREHGMPITFTLDAGANTPDELDSVNRILVGDNVKFEDFFYDLQGSLREVRRAVFIDLDQIYDPDPKKEDENLGKVIQRMKTYGINTVYLKAYSDRDQDGVADALYFPNPDMPMRSDLLNRAAWQLYTRAGLLDIGAWMPISAFKVADRVTTLNREEDRALIKDIYLHMGQQAFFRSILFDDTSSQDRIAVSDKVKIDLTMELAEQARRYSGVVKTAIIVEPTLIQGSKAADAGIDPFETLLAAYDGTIIKAFAYTGQERDAKAWLAGLVERVGSYPDGFEKSLFMLQSVGRSDKRLRYVRTEVLAAQMEYLRLHKALNYGYYPDDPENDRPHLTQIRKVLSLETFPYEVR